MLDLPARTEDLLEAVTANPWNVLILQRLSTFGIADWWLTAGCIAQTVWNVQAHRPANQDIFDYDVFYFDSDVSWEAEDAVIKCAAALFSDLPITVQVRNQARVPVWYREKFGIDYGPVTRASDGILRFPCRTVAIGVRMDAGQPRVFAPYGLDLLFSGALVPNPVLAIADVYAAKTSRWSATWPHLRVEPWAEPFTFPP